MNWLNITVILVVAWVLIFVQSAFNGLRELLGAQIDLLPALMVYTGLSAGLAGVTLVAIVGGLAFDALSANPLGISVLPLFLVGWVIHAKRDLIMREEVYAQRILGLAASVVAPVFTLLLLLSVGETPLIALAVAVAMDGDGGWRISCHPAVFPSVQQDSSLIELPTNGRNQVFVPIARLSAAASNLCSSSINSNGATAAWTQWRSGILLGMAVLLVGLWYVQIAASKRFVKELNSQSFRSVRIPGIRGQILDRNRLPLAENRATFNVNVYLEELRAAFQQEFLRERAGRKLKNAERMVLGRQTRYQVVSNMVVKAEWLDEGADFTES